MSRQQKVLWSVLAVSLLVIAGSLTQVKLQPHRFPFCLPFLTAVVAGMAAASMLDGGQLMRGLAAALPEHGTRLAWQILVTFNIARSFVGGLVNSRMDLITNGAINLIAFGSAAFAILINLYQRSESWPKFDVPEFDLKPRRPSLKELPDAGTRNWFAAVASMLAVVALVVLAHGLGECFDRDGLPHWFFISELGVGVHAKRFTLTLLVFGLLMLPLFATFVTGYPSHVPSDAARFAIGGWLSVCGIIGVGVWDLRHPLHYASILLWLWSLATILDRYIPTPRGLVRLTFPTWILKLAMICYLVSMVLLPFDGRLFCVVSQRVVVAANVTWLLFLLKIVAAEACGAGLLLNGPAEDLRV